MKTSLVLVLFQIAICSNPLSVPPNLSVDTNGANIYETDVLDDLSNIDNFNKDAYSNKWCSFIYFAEYSYDKLSAENFDLIIYYSYLGQKNDNNPLDYMTIRSSNSDNYQNYDTEVIQSNGIFYKARIIDAKILYKPFQEQRNYDVSGISFFSHMEDDNSNYNEYEVGKTFTFTGFAGDTDNPLQCTTSGLETISIEVKGGTWHTASNYGNRNSLFYVWFPLQKKITDGWYLKKIHYEYNRLKLKTLLATDFSEDLDNITRTVITESGLMIAEETGWSSRLVTDTTTGWSFTDSGERLNDLRHDDSRWFYISNPTDEVSRKQIENQVKFYREQIVLEENYFNFNEENSEKTITVPASNMTGFQKWWLEHFQNTGGSTEEYKSFDAWTIVDYDDAALSQNDFVSKYFVDTNQVEAIQADLSTDADLYLFRFEILPFYSRNVYTDYTRVISGISDAHFDDYQCGYYFDCYYIENFDIIDFTFENENLEVKIIPVVADPINIADYGEKPDPANNNWWKKLLIILLLIVLLFIILKLISYFVKRHSRVKDMEKAIKNVEKKKKKKNESNKR